MFNKKTYRILKKKSIIKLQKKQLILINLNSLILNNKNLINLRCFLFLKKKLHNINCRNVCSVTGKYKSIFNSLKISRHSIRRFGDISQLPNYSKFSW